MKSAWDIKPVKKKKKRIEKKNPPFHHCNGICKSGPLTVLQMSNLKKM